MTKQELHHRLNKEIYERAFIDLNLILGYSKSSSTSAGIYLKLPIDLKLVENKSAVQVDKTSPLKAIIGNCEFFVRAKDTKVTVNMTINYKPEQSLLKLHKALEKYYSVFSLIYFHELQHILSFHTLETFDNMMVSICKKSEMTDKRKIHELINRAEDYRINYTINMYCKDTPLAKACDMLLEVGLYETEFERGKLSEIEILKILLKDPEKHLNSEQIIIDDLSGNSEMSNNEESTKQEVVLKSLAETLQSSVESALKGSGKMDSLAEAIKPIKVNTGWFDKLEKTFTRLVYYATNDYSVTWANLDNTYRHIFKSPEYTYYDDSINLVVAIDQSGSMSTSDMGKLLSLVQTKEKKILKLTVLIHDTQVGHVFTLDGEFTSILDSKEFTQAMATRHMSGGTSHQDVFKHLSEMKNLKNTIFVAFTDGYSDLNSFTKYPKLRSLSSKILLLTENNPQNLSGWKEILMQ